MVLMNNSTYFSRLPQTLDARRSRFPIDGVTNTTTFNAGLLIPFMSFFEVLPGDTWNVDLSFAVRMSTPIHPTFGRAYLDIRWFYCPNRLLWKHWREFLGENNEGPWSPSTTYTVPQLTLPAGGFVEGSIGDYLGLPIYQGGPENDPAFSRYVSALPFRMVDRVWSEWYRSSAVQSPGALFTDDQTVTGDRGNSSADWTVDEGIRGGRPYPVNRLQDYFSTAVPQPQYGDALTLNAGSIVSSGQPLSFTFSGESTPFYIARSASSATERPAVFSKVNVADPAGTTYSSGFYNGGLTVDWTTTVNDLRMFFATQKYQEKMALGGNRYREILHTMFGVYPPDASVQVPEYLGGKRYRVGMQQVLQTSSTDSTSPQGNTAAFSFTGSHDHMFTRSFTEHGLLMAFCCVRTENIYEQKIEKKWTRRALLDYYNPTFAHIGYQPIKNKEIWYNGNFTNSDPEGVFAYQMAWDEYRFYPSSVTGYMRPSSPTTLAAWNYADKYNNRPVFGPAWMKSPARDNIDRTIAVESSQTHQFIGEFQLDGSVTRVMPTYSMPGMSGHF